MTIWTCATCAIEHSDTAGPPASCAICSDDRQYVPASGQRWTTRDDLADQGYRVVTNNIPLPERAVRRILDTVLPLEFDRLYGAFGELPAQAHEITERSLLRYIGWLRDEIPE